MTLVRVMGGAGLLAWALAACAGCRASPPAPAAATPTPPSVSAPAAAAKAPEPGAPEETYLPGEEPDPIPQPGEFPANEKGTSNFPRLGQDELRRRFLVYPRATTPIIAMGEQLVAHQTPMTLAFFETKADPIEILEFYAEDFERRGWSWTGLKDNKNVIDHPAISATDPWDDSQMSVIVMSNGPGEPRTVILGIADVRPEARIPDDGELPPYPNSSPIVVRSTENGANAFSQALTTPDPVQVVVAFYEKRMRELGWQQLQADAEPDEPSVELTFAKEKARWRIRVSRQQDQTSVLAVSTFQEDRP